MVRKSGLGRGLDALLPEIGQDDSMIRDIPVDQLDRNPGQPRRVFNEESLAQLAESIRANGILSPLLVVEDKGRYMIVAGERRFRAARMAGLTTVPCLVRDLSEQQQMEAALIENLQREDLNPLEEAEGIRQLMESCGYTQEQAAQRLGKSRPAVANALRLLGLEDNIRQCLADGRISAGHARVLAGVQDREARQALLRKTLNEHLSVRQLEILQADLNAGKSPVKKPPKRAQLTPELTDMQDRLRHAIGMRNIDVRGNDKRGRIILSYRSFEELELIYAALETLESS